MLEGERGGRREGSEGGGEEGRKEGRGWEQHFHHMVQQQSPPRLPGQPEDERRWGLIRLTQKLTMSLSKQDRDVCHTHTPPSLPVCVSMGGRERPQVVNMVCNAAYSKSTARG